MVIDELKKARVRQQADPRSLAFFFFDRQSVHNTSYDAFRAFLAQLIFCRRHDRTVLDIAALARPDFDTGQQIASDDEVFAILHLFLLHFDDNIFVVDAIDECGDRYDFLKRFFRLTNDRVYSKAVLFSRPVVKIPSSLRQQCNFLELDDTQNIHDLRSYIEPEIEDLIDDGVLVLPQDATINDVVSNIVSRADGMFLWATLFLSYLKLPQLSIAERRMALEDTKQFHGLFGLYAGIIDFIEKENPKFSRKNIRRALCWVAGAVRPLRLDELRAAIAQDVDHAFNDDDMIPKFKEALGPMTGALIEVTKEGVVRLIHVTVAEYLVSTSYELPPSFRNENVLDFKPAVLEYYLTGTCLAYLHHTIPLGPYVDRYVKGSTFDKMLESYPLMEYAATYWTTHLRAFIESFVAMQHQEYATVSDDIGGRAVAFFSDKARFTSWVEILWHLKCPQHVWTIETMPTVQFQSLAAEAPLNRALSLFRAAYQDHRVLSESWRDVLCEYPEEIWQPSISAFTKSTLRTNSAEAEVSQIMHYNSEDPNVVVLQTKCSLSGNAIGILLARYQPAYVYI